jgi:hypothetical protein
MSPLPRLIFASRWLQLPLYIGLILAQGVYVWQFWLELVHLIEAAFGNQAALATLVTSTGYQAAPIFGADGSITGYQPIKALNETIIMLVVLALIDVVMISNLLIMVIIGGYETFVSRLRLDCSSPAWWAWWPGPTCWCAAPRSWRCLRPFAAGGRPHRGRLRHQRARDGGVGGRGAVGPDRPRGRQCGGQQHLQRAVHPRPVGADHAAGGRPCS